VGSFPETSIDPHFVQTLSLHHYCVSKPPTMGQKGLVGGGSGNSIDRTQCQIRLLQISQLNKHFKRGK